MPGNSQDGLAWDDSGIDLVPRWTREPSVNAIETVCRERLHIDSNGICSISFHAEGAFNKLYLVKTDDQSLLMRVSLPVCPHDKTRGEVTTMRWVRENTQIPVPKVIDFDDSNNNDIGFEWILMELMPGTSAWSRWRSLPMAQKVFLTQRVAECQAQLFRQNDPAAIFRSIGTLTSVADQAAPIPGHMISSMFFRGDNLKYDVPRGPFRSSHDWLASYLEVSIRAWESFGATAEDEDDKEDAELTLKVFRRLLALLPKIFPQIQDPPERTALYHHDLGLSNILIDEQGSLIAIIDWECVSTLPLWQLTRVPKFLMGRDREDEPKRDEYPDETPSEAGQYIDPDDLDNEGKNTLYWVHLMDYEQTQLRKIYNDKMRSLWPDWDLHVAESKLKYDFHDAFYRCVSGFSSPRLLRWIDRIEAGEFVGLSTILNAVPS